MKAKILLYGALYCVLLFLFGCSQDSTLFQSEEETFSQEIYSHVVNSLESSYNILDNLLLIQDTTSALDSIVKIFLSDTSVQWAVANSQGISIQYKNGIRSGILLNPRDYPHVVDTVGLIHKKIENIQSVDKNASRKYLPNSRKTVFINPHYYERKKYADSLLYFYNKWFPNTSLNKPEYYLHNDASVNRFASLSDYGIIHIYSHGVFFTGTHGELMDVYLLTGEEVNSNTAKEYWSEFLNGDLKTVRLKDTLKLENTIIIKTRTLFAISPKFFTTKNDFKSDTVLIYGGFCGSFLGNWVSDITGSFSEGLYLGFDHSVYTWWNFKWAKWLFGILNDTSLAMPESIEDWFNNNTIPKSYWDTKDNVLVSIKNTGNPNLSLWLREKWSSNIDGGVGSGTWTFNKFVQSNTSVEGEWYWGDLTCTYTSGDISIVGSSMSFTANGSAYDASANASSDFILNVSGSLNAGSGSGSYMCDFSNSNWNDGSGNWTTNKNEGSGITGK